jgi:hypothetical protein
MRGHLMPLAAFFMQPHPPTLALGIIVLDAHGDDGADTGESKRHGANERPIAQPDNRRCVDAVQKFPRLIAVQHRRLAGLDYMLRTTDRVGWVGGDDLAGDEPVEQPCGWRRGAA